MSYSPPEGFGPEHPTSATDRLVHSTGSDDLELDLPPVISHCPSPGKSALYARVDYVVQAARADVAMAEEGRLRRCAYCKTAYPVDETSPQSMYCKRCVERSLLDAERKLLKIDLLHREVDSLLREVLLCPMVPDELQVKIREARSTTTSEEGRG